MTFLIWVSIVGSLLGFVVSNPQTFNCQGSRCTQNNAPAGSNPVLSSATLNCAGSSCTQNNAGRRKREIVAKVLEEIKAAGKEKRSAPPHDVPHHQPDVHVPGVHIPPVHIPEVYIPPVHIQIPPVHVPHVHIPPVQVSHVPKPNVPDVHVPKPHQEHPAPHGGGGYGRKRRDVTETIKAASKSGHKEVEDNAREKNNAGSKKRGVVAEVIEEVRKLSHQNKYGDGGQHTTHPPAPDTTANGGGHVKREADPQILNCSGSSCVQNNIGRRKREVIAAFLTS